MTDEKCRTSQDRSPEVRRIRRRRRPLVFVATAMVGLAFAGPAVAEDGPPEIPTDPPAVPEPSALPAVPVLDELPVVVTEIEGGNVDVSIRVLSPGADETAPEETADAVVSPGEEPSITETIETPDAHAADGATGAANTNVSVRVLSPGDNKGATQTNHGDGEGAVRAGVDPKPSTTGSAPVSDAPADTSVDSDQYQDNNSQYQSDEETAPDAWNWLWVLNVDCGGNATSTSTQSGDPASLEWSWEWAWEWGCADTSGTQANAQPKPGSAATAGPGTTAGSTAPNTAGSPQAKPGTTSSAASGEPWSWTWAFDFCGETTTISTSAGTGTPLNWTWDWTWTWSCATPAAPPSPPAIEASPPFATSPPTPSDEASAEENDAPVYTPDLSFLPVITFPDPGVSSAALALPLAPELPAEVEISVVIPPVVLPTTEVVGIPTFTVELGLPAVGSPASPFGTPRRSARRARPPAAIADLPGRAPARITATVDHARQARPATRSRAHGARDPRARDPLAPLGFPRPRTAAGSSSASGAASSSVLFGVAALIGFIILAAPRAGRRIRVARVLRPRSHDEGPIDHPG
jgi:hypothetical protein